MRRDGGLLSGRGDRPLRRVAGTIGGPQRQAVCRRARWIVPARPPAHGYHANHPKPQPDPGPLRRKRFKPACQRSRIAGSSGMTSRISESPPGSSPMACTTGGPREQGSVADTTGDRVTSPREPSHARPHRPHARSAAGDRYGLRSIVRRPAGRETGCAPRDAQRAQRAYAPGRDAVGPREPGRALHCPTIEADRCVDFPLQGSARSHGSMALCRPTSGDFLRDPAQAAVLRANKTGTGRLKPLSQ